MVFYIPFLILLSIILLPQDAFAWGPATHLELGARILDSLSLLPQAIRGLLERYPYDYLYGCMNADIVIGKRFVHELKHCHNWRIGFKALRKAGSDSQKSFAYGYLSHLAADTIAHNYFIPLKVVSTFSTRTLRHIYWEMRFDSLSDRKIWHLPKRIAKTVHRDNDPLLKHILEDTPLSFRTNKTIYSSILLIHRVEQWHRMIDMLSKRSKWLLTTDERERFFLAAFGVTLDLLHEPEKAPCLMDDPTGKSKLFTAKGLRKKLRIMKRKDGPWQKALEEACLSFLDMPPIP